MIASLTQPIFDVHARLVAGADMLDQLLSAMDQVGIERTAVAAGGVIPLVQLSRHIVEGGWSDAAADNDGVLRACTRSGGRLVPIFFASPHRPPDHYLSRAGEFHALELAPAVSGVPLTDERSVALVAAAAEAAHAVYVHCLIRQGFTVRDLVTLATSWPEVTFILAHGGIGHIDLFGVELIEPRSNIMLETSGGYTRVVQFALERLGPGRVVFGTEFPIQHPSVELAKYRALALDPAVWRQVAWENACRVLRACEP
jgi:predicted TIM-barrel fold metal-dependent hydrolase